MKITRVEAIPFAIPYRKPLKFASGETQAGIVAVVESVFAPRRTSGPRTARRSSPTSWT
ncbi:hypothetical protein [Saccharopolyspora shandongensis]|uniref:hypothetical protein n=1 Tax=Saccharopolyspora shandongensis TaxID=418495 RepID=UPI0033E84F3F